MVKIALAIASAAGLSGCGTFGNIWGDGGTGEREVYGGLVASANEAGQAARQVARLGSVDDVVGCALLGAYWAAVDVPLSVVGDTLTLPLTIPATLRKREAEEAGAQALQELQRNPRASDPGTVPGEAPARTPFSVFDSDAAFRQDNR
jgi:uncharacterized protein YceK